MGSRRGASLWSSIAAAALVLAGYLSSDPGMAAPPQLPVPCAGGGCNVYNQATKTTTTVTQFVTSGQATASQTGNTLTVQQASNQAILNWASFNISADGKVVFQQPSATSIALNKIYQASPSSIFGELTANGQLYLMNANGFVFGKGSTVNTAGLLASSLGLYNGDAELSAGLLSPITEGTPAPALASDGRTVVLDGSGNPVLDANGNPEPVQVVVQPGAQMTAADGGRLMLAGQSVTNGGSLTAPDGQIVLAAGQSVYLTASTDPSVRGLIVEVTGSGTASNQAGGALSAPRGNVSLVGLAVNQSGRISATTAVSANGSVTLQAGDGSPTSVGIGCQSGETLCLNQGGTLTIGSSSDIDIAPDASGGTAVVGQAQIQSTIKLAGEQVDIGGQILAPDADLTVLAAANPDKGLVTEGNSAAQVRIASGTTINLAGSTAQLPMSDNLVSIQLRGNELEDDPDQRNGALHGQTVIADVRQGKPAIISESSWQSALEDVQENILQRTAAGGNASFESEGDVVVGSGATINVSGGSWNYAGGVTQTSELIAAGGQTYNISTASPLVAYTGVLNPTYTQTYNGFGIQLTEPTPGLAHYQNGYSQGFSAGTVTFAAPAMSLQGTLLGSATNGLYQRNAGSIPATSLAALVGSGQASPATPAGADAMAVGGTLIIGDTTAPANNNGLPNFFAPAVIFATSAPVVAIADGTPLPPQPLILSTQYLTSGGFSQTQIFSDYGVTIPAGLPLNLAAGSSVLLAAPIITIDSSIQALGGSISVQNVQTGDYSAFLGRAGINVGDGVTLDVRGQWTNDSMDAPALPPTATYQNGGSINLSLTSSYGESGTGAGGQLTLGNDVSLLASGGAWVQANNAVAGGSGGSITLNASPYQSALQIGLDVTLAAFGVEGASGGSFSLAAPRLIVGPGAAWAAPQRIDDLTSPGQTLQLGSGLFSQDGFSSVTLMASAPVLAGAASTALLTVSSGTSITATAQSLQLNMGYLFHGTGGTIAGLATPEALPIADQSAETITLEVQPAPTDPANSVNGDLDIASGSRLSLNPNADSSINLSSEGSLLIGGVLQVPGGTISAQIQQPSLNDPGYLPGQRLELESGAVLDVSGATIMTPNPGQLVLGTVLPGGSVELTTERGALIADAGSTIAFGGASAELEQFNEPGGYLWAQIGSAGGSLSVQSGESVSLLGALSGGAGVSNAGALEGGSLSLELIPAAAAPGGTPFPNAPFTIQLQTSTAGLAPSASSANNATLGVTQLEQSGIDSLALSMVTGSGVIQLDSGLPLSLGESITLNAPTLSVAPGINAALKAPYVLLTDGLAQPGAGPAVPASASLSIDAQQIGLSGFVTLQGVDSTQLVSSGDVELLPVAGGQQAGALNVAGTLTVDAERVYPATQTSFTINDPTGSVVIAQNGVSLGTPLSAGGSLTIQAQSIDSSGTLLAPFGQIALNASQSLSLEAGSVTSVSGDGVLIPFGQTEYGGAAWIYQAGNTTSLISGIPSRTVTLSAPQVTLASGATVDLKGGGDLVASEWVPGLGGSVDALNAAIASSAGWYAVLPSTQNQYAAYDVHAFPGSSLGVGSSVYLSGIGGLTSGVYELLPASYALLPGAYLIRAEPSFQSLTTGTLGALADGAPVIAGYLTFGNSGLRESAGYEGFAVYPGSYGEQLAQYTLSDASSYFAAAASAAGQSQVALPADAGSLQIAVGSTLNALGSVLTAPASGGSAATIDLFTTGPNALTISAGNSGGSGGSGIVVAAPVLQSWNAGDLILGGELSANGSSMDVTASTVTIAAGAQVSAGQIVAVANQGIDVQAGAVLATTSAVDNTPLTTAPAAQPLSLTGAGGAGAALLAVSDTELPMAVRSGVGPAATIDIEGELKTRGAVAVDAPGTVTIGGSISAPGANWSLASGSIAFVGSGSSSTDTLQIAPALLTELQTAGAVRLSSAGAIDLLTPVSLGSPTLGSLTLSAAAINNAGTTSTFTAQTVNLVGIAAGSSAPTAGTGTLSIAAQSLSIGPGILVLNGNAATTLQVSGAVTGTGTSTLIASGNVNIGAAELTAASGSASEIAVPNGTLQIAQAGSAAQPSTLATSLGGALTLSANQIQDAGSIIVPGGNITLQATGVLALASTANIDAGGITQTMVDQTVGAPGGFVNLTAGGNLTASAGSSISVAGAGAAPAGSLALSSGGTLSLGGTLAGSAASGAIGGSLSIYANQLGGGLPALAGSLASAGFSNQVAVEVASGDLDLPAASSLTANQLTLSADSGAIDIAGTLTAPAAGLRGSIGLFAAGNVTLESSAVLQANGTTSNTRGGEIELSTADGTLNLDAGSVISASGSSQMGSLLVRAPAIVNSGDVAISTIGSNLSNVGELIVEPVLPAFQSNADFTLDFAPIQSAVTGYLSLAQTTIPARFGSTGAASVLLEPGVVVDATGDLTLSQSLDLYQLQLGAPIDLTVRATGSITIQGAITDGIDNINLLLSDAPSSSLRFVAGANLSSANPLATVAGSAANLVLSSNLPAETAGLVQTGTGDIDLIAANDVQFAPGASASTLGLPASPQVVAGNQVLVPLTIDFPTSGGNLTVQAGQDVIQQLAANPVTGTVSLAGSVSTWQQRDIVGGLGQYGLNLNAISYQNLSGNGTPYEPWTLATYGGGDLSITAGRDVVNVSAAAAGSTAVTSSAAGGYTQTHYDSGGLTVQAGRNVTTSQFYLDDGIGTVQAEGSLATNLTDGNSTVGSLFYLGDAEVSVWAQGDLNLAGVVNPTVLQEPFAGGGGQLNNEMFFTYGASSAFSAQSSAGNINVSQAPGVMALLMGPNGNTSGVLGTVPASLSLIALTQNISGGDALLYPSDNGQLQLIAGGNISGGEYAMSDAPDSVVPTVAAPGNDPANAVVQLTGSAQYDFYSGRHAADPNPALVVAGGSIENMVLYIPKPARIESGLDIVNLGYRGQNLNPDDMTLFDAGRDYIDPTVVSANGSVAATPAAIQVGGPGSVDVIAGRDVNLGFSAGIVTIGNLVNPNLPTSVGASITILSGLGQPPDDAAFLQQVVDPSATYQQQLVSYVESLSGQSGLSSAQADNEFAKLGSTQQQALIDSVFFQELNQSGIEANTTNLGYSRGYAAIAALFPGTPTTAAGKQTNAFSGDLDLTYSRIGTLSGGGISLLVPGGSINVGLSNPPAAAGVVKAPADLGIVAQGAGDVDIYALGSVNVNASRIFTLGGGNILIWSQLGSIDAGNGAKTSLSLPPPTYTVDSQGNVQLVYNAAVAGSGIRTIQTSPTEPAGNVDLIAPVGSVNAGDAGIGAAGNINIAAVTVTGVSNINFGGTATGVPAVVSNLGATVSGASSAATSASTSATAGLEANAAANEAAAAPLAQAALSYLEVFVTGLGEEDCKPDDVECLRRQKHE